MSYTNSDGIQKQDLAKPSYDGVAAKRAIPQQLDPLRQF